MVLKKPKESVGKNFLKNLHLTDEATLAVALDV